MIETQLPLTAKGFYTWQRFVKNKKNILLCCSDEESSHSLYKQLKFFDTAQQNNILYFPSLDTIPYDRVSPNAKILSLRARVLTELATKTIPKIIVTSAHNLILKIPPPSVFKDSTLNIEVGSKIDIENIILFLVKNGFTRSSSAVESSEFAVRGEILDIVTTSNNGYRLNFGWNEVESIREYDTYSQISTKLIDNLLLSSASETLLNTETINIFKNNFLQIFGVNHIDSALYKSVTEGLKFHGFEHLTPLFYKEMALIFDYLGDHEIIYDDLCIQSILEYEHAYDDFYESRLISNKASPESFYYAIPPDRIINNSDDAKATLNSSNSILLTSGASPDFLAINDQFQLAKLEQKTEFDKFFDIIVEHRKKIPVIFCSSKNSLERIKNIIKNYDYTSLEIDNFSNLKKNYINLAVAPLSGSFICDKYLLISEANLLGNQFITQAQKSSKKKLAKILTELDNITEGQLIVHKEHGIGRFENIETIHVDGIAHDCIKITYANNDILYLPVENISQFKKYGGDEAVLDKLGSAQWQNRKAKLKNRIKDIAAQLLKITAQRMLATTTAVNFEQSTYEQFCKKFPYSETDDQVAAIEDIKSDLESGRFMDRLICGDVGFGKTEVAMRAAFMVACDINDDRPQIAIIAPTTILCKQHYKNFLERFEKTGLKIAQLSRLVKPNVARLNKAELESGEINIIIGTHALLARDIKFNNLKMIIIDEEQRFGVIQKERLKQLKAGVHVLSLSATPIPRTLQMSMVGIKDLSLIATPPIERLPVRTNILPFDAVIIRDALMRERFRGGLSFYVAPRIKDLEWVAAQLDKIVPELTYKIAHGQMNPSLIDNLMNEFCEGKFDILLSTTIVESGIDISIANTIIIHRADMLGLSQLYQLRGRVGRSKVRGYAYLILNHKKTSKLSVQRLEVLQNLDTLGAGFTIASHDMDLRGFGNLVGDEQSGHIKEVGAELYQEMLDEAINEIKNNNELNKENNTEFTPIINLRIPILIPADYIEDSSLRLAIYRRAGDLANNEEIENFYNEMFDRFGSVPTEFDNLLKIVKLRNRCLTLGIETIDSGPNGFVIKFNKNFNVADMVISFIKNHPRHAKIKPDHKLVFIKPLAANILISETEKLLDEIEKCKE
ncbi:MAG: transcription-repair coupling factor [Rickettsiales bacterium]|nr:MAG: transcription-repair coupling factor [Rickettsiales bacterium]